MITATVTETNLTGKHEVEVEIVDIFTAGDGRKIAVVEALPVNGKAIAPFTDYTMGGPAQTSTKNVPVHFLKNIGIAVELPATMAVEVGSL